jgi:hypothetical protein
MDTRRNDMQDDSVECDALRSFSRPRYFYGQLLDVHHFESEQAYFKRKQWLRNRLVDGFGVVCGLDVQVGHDDHSIIVMPGLALDRQGREIVVPTRSKPLPVPSRPAADPAPSGSGGNYKSSGNNTGGSRSGDEHCDDDWVHLVICYEECKTDPEPVMGGGCDTTTRCSPGAIREGYSLSLQPGKAPDIPLDSVIQGLVKGNNINYRALVEWVSAPCDCDGGPGCITLANIHLSAAEKTLEPSDIDISVRPIVYSLDLLWELVLALSHEAPNRRTGKN